VRFDVQRGKIVAPLVRFSEAFQEAEAAAHESEDMRNDDRTADQIAGATERHRKANAVVEEGPVCGFDEAVVVLEAAEPARDHVVLKEVGRIPGVGQDERYVVISEAEAHTLPSNGIAGRDEASGASFDGKHSEHALHHPKMCGQGEAEANGCMDEEAVPESEHREPFDAGSGYRSMWKWPGSCRILRFGQLR
jgi:hypothetical protein